LNLFYKRFGYDSCKQWYWILRIDLSLPIIQFYKHENKCWDLNCLMKELIGRTKMSDFTEEEILSKLWSTNNETRVEKREFTDDEIKEIENVENKKKKNKMHFLVTEDSFIKKEDLEKIEQIKEDINEVKTSPIIPKNWREERRQLRLKGERNYRKQINVTQRPFRRSEEGEQNGTS